MALDRFMRPAPARTLLAGLAASVAFACLATAAPQPEAPAPDAKGPTPEAPMVPAPKPEPAADPTPSASPYAIDMSNLHPAEQLRPQAARLLPNRDCVASRVFVLCTAWLAVVDPRTIYTDATNTKFLSRAQFESLSPEEQKTFEGVELAPEFYYNTRYGSPLGYTRVVDLLCAQLTANPAEATKGTSPKAPGAVFAGKKWLDFGCGGAVHMQMLAQCGTDIVGVDVDPLLAAVFSEPGDLGTFPAAPIPNADINRDGSAQLVIGSWPGDAATREKVGFGYDIITSKNTLKNGYINPERETNPKFLVKLGVSNEEFVQAVFDVLNPGGYFLIYNLSPAQNPDDQPYLPWADGRSPFSREMLEKVGLEVLEFNKVDDEKAHEMGRALEWDQGARPMNFETDLFSHYTLVRKPGGAAAAKLPKVASTPDEAKPAAEPDAKAATKPETTKPAADQPAQDASKAKPKNEHPDHDHDH